MADNPFQPPAAPVADPAGVESQPPVTVERARFLVLGSLLLGLLPLLPVLEPADPALVVPLPAALLFFALFGGLTLWLVTGVQRGNNRARWGLLAFLGFTWLAAASSFAEDFSRYPVGGVITVLGSVMEMVACVYLFSGAGARWFDAVAAQRAAAVRPRR